MYCDVGLYAGGAVDEFSHWALIVKEMIRLNDFGTNVNSIAEYASYPPGMSLFQYFCVKIHNIVSKSSGFSEWRCYYSFHILMIALIMPFIDNDQKNRHSIIISGSLLISLIILPTYFFHAWRQLLVDFALAFVTGMALARIYIEKSKDKMYSLYIYLCCMLLVLMKDSGFGLSLFVGIAYVIDLCNEYHRKGQDEKFKIFIPMLCVFSSISLPKLLWTSVVLKSHTMINLSRIPAFEVMIRILFGRDQTYRSEIVLNFIEALFTRKVYIGYIGTYSLPGLDLTYFKLFLILLVLLSAVVYYRAKYMMQYNGNVWIKYIFVFYILYNFGVCTTYVSNFGESGGLQLVEYDRYTGVIYLVISCFIVVSVYDCLSQKKSGFNKIAAVSISVCLLTVAPDGYFYYQFSRKYVEDSYNRREIYRPLADIITDNCTEGDRICYVYQQEWNYPYHHLRFLVDPVPLGIISDFCFTVTKEDRGITNIIIKEIKKKLIESYDHVAIYKIDDNFIDDYGDLFFDISQIRENSLYKVDKGTGLLKLMQ